MNKMNKLAYVMRLPVRGGAGAGAGAAGSVPRLCRGPPADLLECGTDYMP